MKTYVAEIDGEAILAFRAENDDVAERITCEEDGGFQLVVRGYSGLLRGDGHPLWNGTSSIRLGTHAIARATLGAKTMDQIFGALATFQRMKAAFLEDNKNHAPYVAMASAWHLVEQTTPTTIEGFGAKLRAIADEDFLLGPQHAEELYAAIQRLRADFDTCRANATGSEMHGACDTVAADVIDFVAMLERRRDV
jgi:hypothetical protein